MLPKYLSRLTDAASEATEPLPSVFWVLTVLIGAGSGLAAGALIRLLHLVEHLAYNQHTGSFLGDIASSPDSRRVAVLTCAGLLVSLFLALKLSGPGNRAASTTGSPRTVPSLVEAFVSIFTVGMGSPLGREAAVREAGALIAARLSERVRLTPQQRTLLIACGAGGGMAAAYNVPFAGALFAVEIVLGAFSVQAMLAATVASCIATACSWLFLPNVPAYTVPELPFTVGTFVFAVVAGPLCGVCSAAFVRLIAWACLHRPRGSFVLIAPVIVLTCVGVASLRYPEMLGNGKEVVQAIFFNHESISVLAVLLFLRPIATVASLRTGAPGGLFTPVMCIGAILGSLAAGLFSHLAPLLHLQASPENALTFVFIGAGATLAAGTQAPISSVLFLLEMTHRGDSLLIPLLLAVAIASVIHRRITPGSIFSVRRNNPKTSDQDAQMPNENC